MQVRRLTLAIMTAGACLPTSALAAADFSPEWWVYSFGQVCQAWSDGIKRCFPVAALGPAPAMTGALPPGLDPLMPALAKPQLPYIPGDTVASAPIQPSINLPLTTPRALSTNPYLVHTPYAAKPAPASNTPAQPLQAPQALADAHPNATLPNPAQTPSMPETPAIAANTPVVEHTLAASPPATNTVKLDDALTHFEFDKAELTDAGRAVLDAWAARLTPGMRLSITGHADRLGPSRYNLALSRRRAESVLRHLGGKGMRANDISLHAKGESEPIVSCLGGPTPKTKACLAANRRVEIKPVM
jgi:outer membrane protein OmpA-like peptidoglycan-associated protein